MMRQFRDKKQIIRRKRITRTLIVVLGLFLFLSFSGILNLSGTILNYIGLPIWESKKVALNGVSELGYLTKTKLFLFEENKNLSKENVSLKISMIDYNFLKDENKRLKELLGRASVNDDFILANILTKPNNSPYDTIIIDIGEDEEILEGFSVYCNGNIPIGVISKVYNKTALVELYSNPGKVTIGVIQNSNINVELIGRGGGNFEMSVPLELITPKGTMIVSPDIKIEILAIVEEIISDPTDPIKKIILRSPINVQNQKWVQVKKN